MFVTMLGTVALGPLAGMIAPHLPFLFVHSLSLSLSLGFIFFSSFTAILSYSSIFCSAVFPFFNSYSPSHFFCILFVFSAFFLFIFRSLFLSLVVFFSLSIQYLHSHLFYISIYHSPHTVTLFFFSGYRLH